MFFNLWKDRHKISQIIIVIEVMMLQAAHLLNQYQQLRVILMHINLNCTMQNVVLDIRCDNRKQTKYDKIKYKTIIDARIINDNDLFSHQLSRLATKLFKENYPLFDRDDDSDDNDNNDCKKGNNNNSSQRKFIDDAKQQSIIQVFSLMVMINLL